MSLEEVYSSSVTKLLAHAGRLEEIRAGRWRPITLQLAPTDRCNLSCGFCSVKERAGDELLLDEIKRAIDSLAALGLRAVEITGGGEPTLHPDFAAIVDHAYRGGLDVGLITNGVGLADRVPQQTLDRLTWLRVSLNGLDQEVEPQIPRIAGDLSFSYIWNELSERDSGLTLDTIEALTGKHHPVMVRIAPDCLEEDWILHCRTVLPRKLRGRHPSIWFQSKAYEPAARCWFGYLKPFLAPDGWYYVCSANPLLERRFGEEFRMGRIGEEMKIWLDPQPRDTSDCGLCFFKAQNELLEAAMAEVPHANFV